MHDESQVEVRVFSILSAINTISQATIAMIDETKPCGHEDELNTLKDKVQQATTTKGELEDQVIDLHQQLDREKRLVNHSGKTVDKYKCRCATLMTEKEQLTEKIRRLKRNQVGYEALSAELSGEITKHYVSKSLVSVLKHEETTDTIHFTLSDLHEVEQSLIEKIQNCSEEHSHPLFKQFVLRYLEEKYKDAPKEEDKEEEDKRRR